jgi:uncharacterized protein with beta-barrel porin domain
VIIGNSAWTVNFNGGSVEGSIDGAGQIFINQNTITKGNIGGSASITSLTISSGKKLDLATNNNQISATGIVKVDSNSTLQLGTGSVFASIRGAADEKGMVEFLGNNTLQASVGTSSASLAQIKISSGATVNTSTQNIDAVAIKIADNAVLNFGNGTIAGAVDGTSGGVGTFTFNNTKTSTGFTIGQIDCLENINLVNSITVTATQNIAAKNINIGSGNGGTLKSSDGVRIAADNINIASGATLNYNVNSIISGAINGVSEGVGAVQFSGAKSGGYVYNQPLGAVNKLEEITVSNQTELRIDDDIKFNASLINVGEGGVSASGVLTQSNGTIGADENSLIKIKSAAVFNYNGGTIKGKIRASDYGVGTFNINHNYANNFKIGYDGYYLNNLNVASGAVLTANADIAANNISVAGALNLSSSSKKITGNIATVGGAATIDLGSFSHIISGNFSTLSGDVLKINAINDDNVGNLQVAGSAVVADGLALKIAFDSNDGYLANGAKINLISASSGTINAVNNIDVNDSGSNQAGLVTFHTAKSDNNLLLIVDRKSAETFSDNQFVGKIYNSVDQVGSKAAGELRNLQKLVDNVATSNKTRELALKSVTPQNNQDLNNSSFNSANSSVNIANARLQKTLLNIDNQKSFNNFSGLFNKENIASLNKLSFGDDKIFDSQSIWLQGFRTSAAQENVGDNDGYNYSNNGLAIGVDQEVAQNLRLGISSSFSTGKAKSNSANQKQTDIDSYQFNLYGGYNFAPYFFSGILGVAINQYNSTRSMPELGLQAKAGYGGETYIAKFETGIIKEFDDFVVTPKFSLTAARNQIDTYGESGAGTLNLKISNEYNNFLEGGIGSDLIYQASEIIKPKLKLSYGYDFLASGQSSTNRFQGQNSSFQIKNSNIDKASLKYGFGLDIYVDEGILLVVDYDAEVKASYKSKTGSIYLRYDF